VATTQTFTTLQTDVRRYLERGTATTDTVFAAELPRMINNSERRIATELKIQGFINVVTSNMVTGESVIAKPDRWRETVSVNFGTGTGYNTRKPLFTRSYDYLRSYWPDPTQTAEPVLIADYNYANFLVAPTPDDDYPFELVYYTLLPLLDDENQTNWLTENFPELLLYAVLLECSMFLKDDKRINVWSTAYDRAAAMINGEDLAKILDRQSIRDKP
jgi:hypothetical protein